jgi:hypothetical protein
MGTMDGQTSATRRQKRPEKTSEGHMKRGRVFVSSPHRS